MYYYINKIKTILEANIPQEKIKYYIIGNFDDVRNNIPKEIMGESLVIIDPVNESTTPADTQRDQMEGVIDVYICKFVREDVNQNSYEMDYMLDAIDILEGTDENGVLKEETIKYQIRKNLTSIGINIPSIECDFSNQNNEQYIYSIKMSINFYDQRNRNNN